MDKTNLFFLLSLAVFLVSLFLLASASPLLNYALGDNDTVPLGSFITWAGLIALPMSLYWGSLKFRKPEGSFYKVLSLCLKITIVLAILWLPISYALAGNMNFNFGQSTSFQGGQTAMKIFWFVSFAIPSVTLVLCLLHLIISLFRSNAKKQ